MIGWSNDEEPTGDVDATAHASVVKDVTPPLIDTLNATVREAEDDSRNGPKPKASSASSPPSTYRRARQ